MAAVVGSLFKKYTENQTRQVTVPTDTARWTAVLEPVSLRPAVTITGSGDHVRSTTNPDGSTTSGIAAGGVGNAPLGAVAAFDGTYIFPVTGVTAGSSGPAGAGTDKGTAVYAVVSSGAITSLTLTSTSNTLYGRIDDGVIVGTSTPVQIGVI